MSGGIRKQNILVLGATGPTGILTVRVAVGRGHTVTVFARNASKLPQDLRNNPSITVIEGQLSSTDILFPLLPTFDSVISLLGPVSMRTKGTYLADFYQQLLLHLHTLPVGQVPYILALGTVSYPSPLDSFSFTTWLLVTFVWILARGAYNEIIAIGKVFQNEGNDLPWTLYRVGFLSSAEGEDLATAGYVGSQWTMATTKKDVAKWLVREAEFDKSERQWVGKTPAIYTAAGKKDV